MLVYRKRQALIWGTALGLHALAFAGLAIPKRQFPEADPGFRLHVYVQNPPEESSPPPFVIAMLPEPMDTAPARQIDVLPPPAEPTPEPTPEIPVEPTPTPSPPPTPTPPPTPPPIDEDLQKQLAADREKLRAAINREHELAAAPLQNTKLPPPPPPSTGPSPGSIGTIRSLEFEGHPQPVVDEIMNRYKLRITVRKLTSGSNQSFLSSAADKQGDRFYADRRNRPGIYQVFELSRQAVAKMSELEEAELKTRGYNVMRTRVKEVRFGIVQTAPGQYDIGIIKLEAEELR